MISLLGFIACLAGFAALALLVTPWRRRLAAEEKTVLVCVSLLTVLINGESVAHWWGRGVDADPVESWGDYLQVLQPLLWGMFFYVVVQSASRRELVASRQRMRSIVENMPVILHAYDETGRLLAWNRYAEETSGYNKSDLLGKPETMSQLFPDPRASEQFLQECKKHGASYSHRVVPLVCREGKTKQIAWYNISAQFPVPGWANWGIGFDITEQLATQRELEHKATHDQLTGLPNRALLRDRLVHALSDAERHRQTGALLLLDLDHFKMINDAHGHPVGDRLLRDLGERLSGCIKTTDTLARFGGDEFVILLERVGSPEEAALVAERIISALAETPFNLFGNAVRVTTSIGVTIFPDDDVRIDELIKNVDLALYAAKQAGRNGYHFYSRAMHNKLRWQHKISERLRAALAAEAFELHYQPQLALQSHRLVGAEALLRWNGVSDVPMPPSTFIPIAENMGLMPLLGKWVVDAALKQAALWQNHKLDFPLAINLSPVQFYQPNLLEILLAAIDEHGVKPEKIEFEVTESAVMRDMDASVATMKKLAQHGFGISLDDFGTGYSSLSYLKRFPVSKIKIDQSFVQGIESDPADAAIVRSVIDLGHCLNIKVLAEGVETQAQYQRLGDAGCDYVQGFFCSKPLSPPLFNDFLAKAG